MKIIILHGEDTEKSYERLLKFIETAKGRSWEIVYIDGMSQSFEEILSASSLFGAQRFFILKDIKKIGKKESAWLKRKYTDLSGNLIIYHTGIIGQTFLKSVPKDLKIEEFKLPKFIWNFLDDLYPGNSKKAIKEFHQIIKRDAPEFVFSLISKRLRDLYWILSDPGSVSFARWQISRLKMQAKYFNIVRLKELINKLSEIDTDAKTGKADLTTSLDLLIIKQLE